MADKLTVHIKPGGREATVRSRRQNGRHTIAGDFSAYDLEQIAIKLIRVAGEMRARQPLREVRGEDVEKPVA